MTAPINPWDFITVVKDRYSGGYSDHKFTAWPGDPPWEIDSGDTACMCFWDEVQQSRRIYGGGETAQEALQNLLTLMAAAERFL